MDYFNDRFTSREFTPVRKELLRLCLAPLGYHCRRTRPSFTFQQ